MKQMTHDAALVTQLQGMVAAGSADIIIMGCWLQRSIRGVRVQKDR
jgi:hypothetical protein